MGADVGPTSETHLVLACLKATALQQLGYIPTGSISVMFGVIADHPHCRALL